MFKWFCYSRWVPLFNRFYLVKKMRNFTSQANECNPLHTLGRIYNFCSAE